MYSITKLSLVRSGLALALAASVALFVFAFSAQTANAHQDPDTCTDNGIGISLGVFRSNGTTSIGGLDTVTPGETIKYRATLTALGLPNCNFSGGTLTITTPDGAFGAASTTIPLVSIGQPFVSDFVDYVVDSADVGGDGDIDASASYTNGVSHNTTGQHESSAGSVNKQTLFEKASPTIATTPSAGGPIGTELNDTATLSGGSSPTGNVTFELFPPSDATCEGTPVFSQVDGAAAYTTGPGYTSLVAGTYRWTADYAGDANNNAVSSGCQEETVVITKASPTIATVPSAGGAIGTVLNDIATLSGGSSPTGNVTFTLYAPSDATCSAAAVYTDVDASAPYATTGGYTSLVVGVYHWKAAYAGDANNNAVTSPCSEEAVTITKASPTISTTPSAGGPVGTVLNDTATLSGGSSPTGNVTFKLFPPSDATCQSPEVFSQVDSAAAYTTGPGYTSLVAGTYRWTADYAGDANNNAVSSGCQDEQVTVTQPLQIEKTVNTSYDQKWNWTIDKSADKTNLLLAEGESYTVNYTVAVGATSAVQNSTVSGTITVTNPAGNPTAHITNVTDSLSLGGGVTVVCPGGLPQDLVANTSLVCTYTKNLAAANTDQTNTATVTATGVAGASTAPVTVDFTTPANVIDECVNVTDTYAEGPQGVQVCAGDGDNDETFNYAVTFGPQDGQGVDVPVACGENTHPNTASFLAVDDDNDTAQIGSDDWTVNVTVECNRGCTLTQGYWKTHNDSFKGGAPTDDNWDSITTLAELTGFFTNVAPSYPVAGPNTPPFTWFGVFQTAPKGNAYYQLAHQWMAATLNVLNGAGTTAAVDSALASAQTFFTTSTPTSFNALGKKSPVRTDVINWAGTLGSFNEGTIGPGHCDEQNPA